MVKFKKGDRVKALVNGVDYKIGDEFVLTADGDDKSVYFDDNVGDDRIRPQEEFELLPIAVATGAVDNKSALQIEAGKYYLTSGGLMVGAMEPWPLGGWHADRAPVPLNGGLWNDDGTAWFDISSDSPNLIAEWVDEPAIVTAAETANDNTPPVPAHQEAQKIASADASFVMDLTNGVLTMDTPKPNLLRTKRGYGFEIARHGDYVWVDTGLNAPIAFKAANVKAA